MVNIKKFDWNWIFFVLEFIIIEKAYFSGVGFQSY